MALDTQSKLSHLSISLHWLVGLTFISLLIVGVYMHENEVLALYPLHKSVGVVLFLFILVRVLWRLKNGWPKPASTYKRYEQILSKVIHWVLIVGTLVMPISGMMYSGGGGYGISVFGLELIADTFPTTPPFEPTPLNETAYEIGHILHGLVGKIMIFAVLLHIAGALKHHIIDKDGTLKRMLGKSIGR